MNNYAVKATAQIIHSACPSPSSIGFIEHYIQQVVDDETQRLREEIENAYWEGYEDRTSFRQLESEDWNRSRAKQVAEGVVI